MNTPKLLLAAVLVSVVLAGEALARPIEVLRARRDLVGLSSNGNGGSIYRGFVEVDLRLQNLAYDKTVGIRWTKDDWKTHEDAAAHYVKTFADGHEHWRVRVEFGNICRNAIVGGGRGDLGPAFFTFAAFYEVNGTCYWDSDNGRDHAAAVTAPLAEPLPEARRRPTAVHFDGDLYIIGGQNPDEPYYFTVPNVLRLDPDTGRWTEVAELPSPPSGGPGSQPYGSMVWFSYQAVALAGGIHVFGGSAIKVGGDIRAHYRLDPGTGTWIPCDFLPVSLSYRRALAHGGELHLVPVTDSAPPYYHDMDKVFIYDPASDSWRKEPVSGFDQLLGTDYLAVAAGGALYFLGGQDGGYSNPTPLNEVYRYDPATRRLELLPACPYDIQRGARAAVMGDAIVIANARVDQATGSSDLLVYDLAAGAFRRVENAPFFAYDASFAAAPPKRVSPGAGSRVLETLLVFTGSSGVDTYEPVSNTRARGLRRTIVKVVANVGYGHRVALRGSAAPLSWDRGVDCTWTEGNVWVFETTELIERSAYVKPLVDDTEWWPGRDRYVSVGHAETIYRH